jgi:hypothetical protein
MNFSINSSVAKKSSKSTKNLTNIFNDDDLSDENVILTDTKKFPQSVQWFNSEQTTPIGIDYEISKTELNGTDKDNVNECCNDSNDYNVVSLNKETKTCATLPHKDVTIQTNPDKKVKTSGLIYSGVSEKGKNQTKSKEPRYIQNLLRNATRREMELEIVQERQLKRESSELKDTKEIFVTSAYKKRLEERKKFEEELMLQDLKDAVNDPCKKKDLTSFHQYMLSSGLAARTKNNQQFKSTT